MSVIVYPYWYQHIKDIVALIDAERDAMGDVGVGMGVYNQYPHSVDA
jgi:hypothetical protein